MTYWLVQILNVNGIDAEPQTFGPYHSDTAQLDAAAALRDEQEDEDRLYWLDVDDGGKPEFGVFDPMFFAEKKR